MVKLKVTHSFTPLVNDKTQDGGVDKLYLTGSATAQRISCNGSYPANEVA